jgi:hypothetical protein
LKNWKKQKFNQVVKYSRLKFQHPFLFPSSFERKKLKKVINMVNRKKHNRKYLLSLGQQEHFSRRTSKAIIGVQIFE